MASSTLYDTNSTDANNVVFSGISEAPNVMTPANARAMNQAKDGAMARFLADFGGTATVGGTANALTVTLSQPFTAYGSSAGQIPNGARIAIKAASANTTAATININAIGTKAICLQGDSALVGGEMLANGIYLLRYDTAYNSAAGAWVLLNSATGTDATKLPLAGGTMTGPLINTGSSVGYEAFRGVSTDAGAANGPLFELYRNSASPAANDIIGLIALTGQNSTPAKVTYGFAQARIDSPTAASEAATMLIGVMKAGVATNHLLLGANAAGTATANAVGLPLGQLSFPATQNASSDVNTLDDYEEGTWTPGITFGGSATGITYSRQAGYYIKIGRLLYASFSIILSSKGAQTGGANITGMPFSIGDGSNVGGGAANYWANMASIVGNVMMQTLSATTTLLPSMSGAVSVPQLTNSNFTDTSGLAGTIMCTTSA